MTTLRFTINGLRYWIDEFSDGYAWLTCADEGESFPTQAEAQQDALRHAHELLVEEEQEREQERDNRYGSYEEQRFSAYRALIHS
jgi:hypothetical protein